MVKISKGNWLRFGTIALILIFLLSIFAAYLGYNSGSSGKQTQQEVDVIAGTASANATLSSYSPSIEIDGDSPSLAALIKELKSSGMIVQDIKTSKGRILMATDSKYVVNISSKLDGLGLAHYAEAVLSTDAISFASQQNTTVIEGQIFKLKMAPVFEEGETFPIQFSANVAEGKLVAYGQISFMPQSEMNAQITPINATLLSTSLLIQIPWENRSLDISGFNSTLSKNADLNYSSRSYVLLSPELTGAQLQQISLQKPAYITGMQPSTLSISPSFSNKSEIESFLSAYGASVQFPPSQMLISPTQNSTLNAEGISASFFSAFGNLSQEAYPIYIISLQFPATVESEGKTYSIQSQNITINSPNPPTNDSIAYATFTPVGSRALNLVVYDYSPKPVEIELDSLFANATKNEGG